jgi:hypothetical protein
VVVSGEGKGPEAKFGSDDFQEEDRKGTTVIVSKIVKTISKPRFVRRLWDKFRRNLVTSGTVSGI